MRRTYGYEPRALTTAAPGEDLSNGLVFCRIDSWLTGRRIVSLPFSDHCQTLAESETEFACLLAALKRDAGVSKARHLEIRPIALPGSAPLDLAKTATFCLHRLDLRPCVEELFRHFHKDCTQRKIRRAEREALDCEEGRTESLADRFYHLLLLTRRRQQLPPQPRAWFRNLAASMGDRLKIRLASRNGQPVASILTLQHKSTLVYKYGCSDKNFANLGGMQLLFWKAIQDAKRDGLSEFDLGRSDWDNQGLIDFKSRWGAAQSSLTYWRCPAPPIAKTHGWTMQIAKQVFAHLPDSCLTAAGNLLYKHVG